MSHFARHLENRTIVNPFPGIAKLEAALGRTVVSRLGANESMAKPASPLLAEWGEALTELARLYPDPYALALRERAARLHGVDPSQVVFDAGADSLILLALRLRCNAGDAVVCSAGTYPSFRYFADGIGARAMEVSYQQEGIVLRPHLERMCEIAQAERAAVVYLANPDNPTGYYWSQADILALRQRLPAQTLLILDEAYVDFCVAPQDAPPVGALPNTMRLRTLSKAYGLAGLRVGFAIAPEDIVAKADQIRPQYAMSGLAQHAARLVMDDPDYARSLIQATLQLREKLDAALRERDLTVLPSHTNFVALVYPGADSAEAIQRKLLADGIAVHRPSHPALRHLLRVTAQPQALSSKVLEALAGLA
ncbi:histidinol-phosphate transaminase [Chromobacterium sp. IIBBL 290-4]|uniref:pyridoxal phosphate-dependent aminotransferase n=1 Tax=Chromobacterium sp. IIBBL 290-4 TaxID=2953890 RepID=UPI0020B8E633|nr:aminotransferase class I/II-fold pyridoxal phosphate-dependent enzyme [Chromobacterium sp. IIBBL 290-4]UTH75848.1 aminotransferase class I/II-fold pyridoxal phosphate-dependent enzyme [Chromobacterium sp. IIBBL 290-4]